MMTDRTSARRTARRRQLADLHVLRYVPGTSAIHRCWAGTKILTIATLSIGLLLWPTWSAAGLIAALVMSGFLVARLPAGVSPRAPGWLWAIVGLGAVLALVSGGRPDVHVGSLEVGVGGLAVWARFSLIGIEVLALAALVGWTTPLADLAPALARLGTPLRRVRVPVDEVVGAIALGIRCLPLLLGEARVLSAARRTRRPEPLHGLQERANALEEILFTALSSALRRARELAEAMEARGGTPSSLPETHPLGAVDLVVLGLAVLAVVGMALLR
ncbi:MAG: energy-coupling factor transporter transmembrane component T family protein [Acidimicrobiales bacterium]|jgi:energy-coupling factor transporter transmembrane protein EcfT